PPPGRSTGAGRGCGQNPSRARLAAPAPGAGINCRDSVEVAPAASARLPRFLMVGPVFELEWKRMARRWQMYAARVLVGLAVLLGIYLVWRWQIGSVGTITGAQAAHIGESCIYALIVLQLAVVLIVSPVTTAAAISDEKLRGRLVLLFATHLGAREIVM